jgi:hypothetical protein
MSPAHLRNLLYLGVGFLSVCILGGALAHAGAEEPKKKDPPPKQAPEKKPDTRTQPASLSYLWLEAIQRLREAEARAQCARNLRQISIAAQKYEEGSRDAKTNPIPAPPFDMSALLPYIERDQIYQVAGLGGLEAESRLGAELESVGDVLRSQLGIGKNQGQALRTVKPGGPADKAGLKQYDILLELNGNAVPGDPAAFAKGLASFKEGTRLNVVVLRGGKRTEVKGLVLAKADAKSIPAKSYECPTSPVDSKPSTGVIDGTSSTILLGERWQKAITPSQALPYGDYRVWSDGKPILATTHRNKERFTSRHQEGTLVITVTGTVKEGKARPTGIRIQEGTVVERYTALDKVPEEYRDKVAHLLQLSAQESSGLDW